MKVFNLAPLFEEGWIFNRISKPQLFRTNSVYGQTSTNRRKSSLSIRMSHGMSPCEESLIGDDEPQAMQDLHNEYVKSPIINVPKVSTAKITKVGWFSAFIALFSATFTFFWPSIVHGMFQLIFVLKDGSILFEAWRAYPVPIYTEIYLFNCTNSEDIYKGAKPKFTQLGPYVFREYDTKEDIEFTDYYTVKYNMNRTWVFQPDMTNGSLDDSVTSLDLISYTAAYVFRNNPSLKFVLSNVLTLYGYKAFSTHKVRNLLFEGIPDPLLKMGYLMPIKVMDVPFDKLGFFYSRNGSTTFEGRYEVNTGVDDVNKVGSIASWNNKSSYSFYEGECSKMYGSTGEFRGPGTTKESIMTIFTADICRTLQLSYKEDVTLHGLSGYRFSANRTAFGNSTTDPSKKCFEKEGDTLYPDGVLDVGKCRFGAPLLVSLPHFLHGDPSLIDAVEGMHPDEDLHQTFVDVEPLTSLPFRIAGNLQINIALQPIRGMRLFSKAPKVIFPVIWLKQIAELTPDYIKLLKLGTDLEFASRVGFIVLLCVSLEILIVCLVWRIYKQMKLKNTISEILYREVE